MFFKNTKRRSKLNIKLVAILLALVLVAIASPFMFVFDFESGSFVAQNSAQAFDFSLTLDNTAKGAGLEDTPPLVWIIGNLIYVFLGFLGVIFLVVVIMSGIKWMTAGGNEEAVSSAKKTITRAAIGVVLALLAYGITNFILDLVLN